MHTYQITSRRGSALYAGPFRSFKSCLEAAVTSGAKLNRALLAKKNLACAALDDALLEGADMAGCNLSGANLSEARLKNASLARADLYNACLAQSDLRGCDFTAANFGATDISGADISGARFSGLSCFTLDFAAARALNSCKFINPDGQALEFSTRPIIVRNATRKIIIISEQWVKVGHDAVIFGAFGEFTDCEKSKTRTLSHII